MTTCFEFELELVEIVITLCFVRCECWQQIRLQVHPFRSAFEFEFELGKNNVFHVSYENEQELKIMISAGSTFQFNLISRSLSSSHSEMSRKSAKNDEQRDEYADLQHTDAARVQLLGRARSVVVVVHGRQQDRHVFALAVLLLVAEVLILHAENGPHETSENLHKMRDRDEQNTHKQQNKESKYLGLLPKTR